MYNIFLIVLYADLFLKYKCGNMSDSLSLLNWQAKEGWVSEAIGGLNLFPNKHDNPISTCVHFQQYFKTSVHISLFDTP